MTIFRLAELSPAQIEARLHDRPILVQPFGTIEWHSHHLPLGLDGLVAEAVAERVAEAAGAVLAPVSYWAVGGIAFPYTLKLSNEVVEPLYIAAFEQFAAMGFRVIVAFTGHFSVEQLLALKRTALTVMERSPVTILPVADYDLVTDLWQGDHAAAGETSLLWAVRPELVNMAQIADAPFLEGIIGEDPRISASAAHGSMLLAAISSRIATIAERLLIETTAVQRVQYIECLRAIVKVLEATAYRRSVQPKSAVPPLTTAAYLACCRAIYSGDYVGAKANAERKLHDLTE